jgi:hypothetical protein
VTGCRQGDPELRALAEEEGVGLLHQDASAVPALRLRAACTTVVKVGEDLHPEADDLVGSDVVEIGHEPHAARVVLEAGVIETLAMEPAGGLVRLHLRLSGDDRKPCRARRTGG